MENNPSDQVPKWVTDEFITKILDKDNKTDVMLKCWNIQFANEKGENYASIMYRISVELEAKDKSINYLSYILKIFPEGIEGVEDMLKIFNMFPREIFMYEEILPKLNEIFKNVGVAENFAPRCILISKTPTYLLVFEDLSSIGFKMANRLTGLDMNHTKLVLEKMAKFHAASAKYKEMCGSLEGTCLMGLLGEETRDAFEQYFDGTYGAFLECLKSWPACKEYGEKLNLHRKNLFKILSELSNDYSISKFHVINHGDLWTNNAMFKYDEEKNVTNVLFIDFQMVDFTSPAMDLNYFIFSSCDISIKINEFDTLIQFYYENLVSTLKLLNYSGMVPSLLDFQVDILRHGCMAVMSAICELPMSLVEACNEADMGSLIEFNETALIFKHKMFMNPNFINEMKLLLPFFDKKGWLDS